MPEVESREPHFVSCDADHIADLVPDVTVALDLYSWIKYTPRFLTPASSNEVLQTALAYNDWELDGDQRRRVCWYGTFRYVYTGADHKPNEMPAHIARLNKVVSSAVLGSGVPSYDGVLLNLYQDGEESVGFHQDNEESLDAAVPIAIVSVGDTRSILFEPCSTNEHPVSISLEAGSLLVVGGDTQSRWKHSVPREPLRRAIRLSLTFRRGKDIGLNGYTC